MLNLKKCALLTLTLITPQLAFADFFVIKPAPPPELAEREYTPYRQHSITDVILESSAATATPVTPSYVHIGANMNETKAPECQAQVQQVISENIEFTFKTNSVTFEGTPEQVAALISKARNASAIVIVGYTDSTGSAATNQRVALNRANAARQLLLNQGVAAEKISTSQNAGVYTSDNKTVSGRMANRRIVITFYF